MTCGCGVGWCRWRRLLMELFSEHKDSKLLGGYCMHKMSMAGHNTGTRPLCPSALPHVCTLVLAPDLPCPCLAPIVCVCVQRWRTSSR
jgi:hypothetical protein